MLIIVRILVVDDEPDIATSLKVGLQMKGFHVEAFDNPLEALAKCKPGTYDILIIDLRMPEPSRVELVREIRKNDTTPAVWILTAFEILEDEYDKLFGGIDVQGVVRKPISINELASKILTELKRTERFAACG